ncbi:MAG TPA: hypothetical protein PLN48_17065 [Lachnospiraceae bacterium]|nr:hypothetical protein [Lachnospiraceae bacterium]
MSENTYPLTDEIIRTLEQNSYYAGHKGNQLIFTDDFYIEMYKKVTLDNKTYAEAYNELGFDTAVLGVPRANAVGMRVMKMADEHKLFKIDYSKVEKGMTDFGIVPEQEVVYLLCERVEFMRRLLESIREVKREEKQEVTS